MAYEFKKLSDVEAVEAISDNANVLIEENGVIKKAPKAEVGSGGTTDTSSSDWDVIIDLGGMPPVYSTHDIKFVEGNYDIIKEKLDSGDQIKMSIIANIIPQNRRYYPTEIYCNEDGTIRFTCFGYSANISEGEGMAAFSLTILSDNTFSDYVGGFLTLNLN